MKRLHRLVCALLLPLMVLCSAAAQQTPPATIQFQGLRSVNHQGSFGAAAFTPDGNLVFLYNQGDGLRLLKTDPQAQTLLAQIQLGAAGDTGTALAIDPVGNLYVVGTSSSGSLSGTAGAAFLTPVDTSINSFLAKFDSNLNLLFLTFLGASHTVAAGVAVTANAAFITGLTYSSTFPTTPTAILPTPALDSEGNGFVQRFATDGTTLVYSTYLTGTGGNTAPNAIVADASGNATVAGSTSAAGFPTTATALQSTMLGTEAGFLAKLSPAGDSFVFSTFIAGTGLSSLALDPLSGNLLATGNLSPSQFPLTTVAAPIANTPYQSLLRLSPDGQTLLDSALLLPGTRSAVTPGPNGTAWITGTLSSPPFGDQGATSLGDSYLLHLNAQDAIDQAFRLGGVPTQNPGYAHLTTSSSAAVLNPTGTLLVVPSTLAAQTDPSFANTQTFDLPLAGNPPPILPNSLRDLLPSTCSVDLPCSGSAAFSSTLSTAGVDSPLSLSTGDLPALTLRNPAATSATNLLISSSGFSLTGNCPQTLAAASQCAIALSGSGPGTLSVASSAAPVLNIPLPPLTGTPQPLALDTTELDFGIVTSAASPATRTIVVTNLTATAQTFASAPDGLPTSAPYTLAETASTCPGASASHTVPANGSCSITFGLSSSSSAANDGPVLAGWKLGERDITVTGYTQAASLAISSPVLDFGIQTTGIANPLPRFLYLSNSSPLPIDHAPLSLPSNFPFTVVDNCPYTLQPNTVCQLRFTYSQTVAPAFDSFMLPLDGGLTVLLEGQTSAAQASLASLAPSPLVVSPSSVQFSSSVAVSGISTETQTVQVTNPTQTATQLTASVLGDFVLQNPCASTLLPGASCTLGLQFTPSQSGVREGLLTLSAGSATQPITVPLSGTATPLLKPADTLIDLGQTSIAEPVVHWMQVQGTLPLFAAAVSGGPFGVALLPDDGNGHGTLAAKAFAPAANAQCVACWLAVQFLPTAAGDFTANLQLTTDPSGLPTNLALHGTAIPSTGLLLTPAQPDFAAVPVHSTSGATTFTLTNLLPGAAPLTLQTIAAAGDFTVLPPTSPFACAGALTPAASCSIDVAFSPSAQGLRTGTLTVQTSAGTATANLGGIGTPDSGLALNPATLTFSGILTDATLTLSLTNTGTDPATLGPITSSDPAFTVKTQCASLSPGQSCTAVVSLTGSPASPTALLSFSETLPNAGYEAQANAYAIPLLAPPSQTILAFPTQADFGAQPAQLPGALRQFQIINNSATTQDLVITSTHNFPLTSSSACTTLAPGDLCTLSALFLPQEAGPLTGAITITPSTPQGPSSTPTVIYLGGYGTGTGSLTISEGTSPTDAVTFDPVISGQTATYTLTLTNAGATPVSLRRLASTVPFQTANTCPPALDPAATCSLTVVYAPVFPQPDEASQSVRTDTGTLLLETDDAASPVTVYLAGTVTSTSSSASTSTALPTYSLGQTALTFPNTLAGQTSASENILVTNSGTVPVVFNGVTASSGFTASTTCATLPPGSTCTLTAAFTPDASANNSTLPGTLTLQSNAATALEFITLLGPSFQTPMTASPTSLAFTPVLLGSSTSLTVAVTNITDLPLSFTQPSAQGDFTISGGTCPTTGGTLAPGASCTLVVTFTPTAPGTRAGTLSVPTGTSQALSIPLQGTALAPQLQASPTTLNFGSLNLTGFAVQTLTLTNTGTATLTGLTLSLSGLNAADFTFAAACDPTLLVNASCTIQVTFTPSASGTRTATLTVASANSINPTLIALTGTGAQALAIVLTVNGANSASATIASGANASFGLTLTPQGGYAAGVALICTAVTPAPNAICSLSNANIPALGSPVQITALLTTENGYSASPFALSLFPSIPWILRRRRSRRTPARRAAIPTLCLLLAAFLTSCANGPGTSGNPYTPPGSYLYQVTARSTSGPTLSSTVTLAVTVH